MLRDYFRSVWLGVLHNKIATLINVGGLTLGLTVFFALTFYVQREFSFDAHWEDADRIYRLTGIQEAPTGNTPLPSSFVPYMVGTSLQSRNSDAFEAYARVYGASSNLTIDGKDHGNQFINYAEPGLLELVQLEMLEGSLQEVFADPRSVALSDRTVERLFGKEASLGKILTLTSQLGARDYVVNAVYRIPEPTSLNNLQMLALLDPAALPTRNVGLDLWNQPQGPPPQQQPFFVSHYFKLRDGVAPAVLEADLRAFMDENRYMEFGDSKTRYLFQPLQDAHLSPDLFSASDNVRRLFVFEGIGVLVLLISGCNFVMLATLRLVDRMREVGIRKTIGGEAGQLVQQYLLDAFCQTLIAAVLAIALLTLTLPILQAKLQLPLTFDLLDWGNLGLCLVIVMGFTLTSAAYPALLMSKGKPASLLRNSSSAVVASGNMLRRLLVAIQFAIVIVLLLASGVVQQQIQYAQTRDRGFSLENVVGLRLNNFELMTKAPALVTEVRRLPGVEVAAMGGVAPATIMINPPTMVRTIAPDGSVIEAPLQQTSTGYEYFKTLSVPVLAGREFAPEIEGALPLPESGAEPPPMRNIVLNRSAALSLGFTAPDMAVERLLEIDIRMPEGEMRKQSLRVIGVVEDTQFSSIMLPPVPQFYGFSAQNGFFAVKLLPGTNATGVTDAMKIAWTNVMGDVPFPLVPTEQLEGSNTLFRERFEARIVIGSTILAMVIALLGLYGLVAATVVKRIKEIGVRKVMGADRTTIVSLLLWQFSKPVLVANLIAWPLGFWGIMQWLQRFPYQLDTRLIVLSGLAASVLALLVAWFTVGFMAAKAASVKPVLALRYE